MATLIHQTETFTNLAPIDKSDLLALDRALDDFWPELERARAEYVKRKASEDYHRYYEGMYSPGEEQEAKIRELEAELNARAPSRHYLIEFESDKKLRGGSFREILRHTESKNEEVENVFVRVECGGVSAVVYITPTFGIFDKNYLSISTEPEENEVAVELFRVLREWAVSLTLTPKYASIRSKAYWYSSLVWGCFLAMAGHHAWDNIKGKLDLADQIVFNGWNIAILWVTAMYITKLSQAKFNGVAIGKGEEEVKKSKAHTKFYYEDLPVWFTVTIGVIVLTEVVDYFVKYNAKP